MKNQNVINYLNPILDYIIFIENDKLTKLKNQETVKDAYYFLLNILSDEEKKWLLSKEINIHDNIYVQNGDNETEKRKSSWTKIVLARMT